MKKNKMMKSYKEGGKGAYGMKMKKKSMGMGGMKMKSTYKHGGKSDFRGNHQHN